MIRKRYVSANKLNDETINDISKEEKILQLEVIRDAMLHVEAPKDRWDLADSYMLILKDLLGNRNPDGSRNQLFYEAKNSMYQLAENGSLDEAEDDYLKAVDAALGKVKEALALELEPA